MIAATGIVEDDSILDLCCGQGRHALALARRGYRNVSGIDRSRYLVRLARRRAREAGLPVMFREGDARRFRLPRTPYDCVAMMGNSFGYFDTPDDDLTVLKRVRHALKPGGVLAMDLTDGEWMKSNFERRSWEWIDENHFVCRERSLGEDGNRLITREVVVHAEKGVIADQFYAERLYSRAAIRELIELAGFTGITLHGEVSAESDRGQDLGMMANRIMLSARSIPSAQSAGAHGPLYRDVTVLLGDPRLPDSVKLSGAFGELDIDTVDRLKDSLSTLEGYRFHYFDDHGHLLDALRDTRPDFVLNLCDEGFRNDAVQELHIAAYLEMLRIPYSGAGPSALGLCYNKSLVRGIAADMDIRVPLETYCDRDDVGASVPSVYPALIKPALGDSSVGITQRAVVANSKEASAYLSNLREAMPDCPILIQEYLSGREYTVGLIGNPGIGYNSLPVLEVDYGRLPGGLPHILSYESKWDPESPYWDQIFYREADIAEDLRRSLVDSSIKLFERLDCRDYARFDFRADRDGIVKLLEVNPNPGWCWDGKLNLMAGFANVSYADLLRQIIEAAQSRYTSAVQQQDSLAVVA